MNMHNTICSFLFLVITFISCKTPPDGNNAKPDIIPEANDHPGKEGAGPADVHQNLNPENSDTLIKGNVNNNEAISVNGWKTEDFIISTRYKKSKPVRLSIEHQREEWKNVKNPFVAIYRGCDLGDYFHLNFEDTDGKSYDFGYGNNNYGKYALFNNADYSDNPRYTGRSFIVFWSWKATSFPCCDGEYDMVEAYLPSITRLELTGTDAAKK